MTLTAANTSANEGAREAVICASKGLGKPQGDSSSISVKQQTKN
jgi:hypothetical protein